MQMLKAPRRGHTLLQPALEGRWAQDRADYGFPLSGGVPILDPIAGPSRRVLGRSEGTFVSEWWGQVPRWSMESLETTCWSPD